MRFTFPAGQITVNIPTYADLRAAIRARWEGGDGFALATLNLDHLVKLRADAEFMTAYQAQDFIVADGWPIVRLSRMAKDPVELMPGSDLIFPLSELAAAEGKRLALVGSTPDALADAAAVLQSRFPNLEIPVCIAPPMDFDAIGPEADQILDRLVSAEIDLCFIALGAPRQERFAARGRALAPRVGFASIGAGLDFLGGHQRRAPEFVRRFGLEWLWRVLSDPRRLGRRYLRCVAILPGLVLAARRQGRG